MLLGFGKNKEKDAIDKYMMELVKDIEEPVEFNKKDIGHDEIIDEIIQEFIISKPNLINAVERGIKPKDELRYEIETYLSVKYEGMTNEDIEKLIQMFEIYVWGYGPLQPLIDDPNISDIKTIDYDNIRVKVNGKRFKSDIKFSSRESLRRYINYISIKNNALLSEINSIQKVTDKTSSKDFILRINLSSEFINSVDIPYLVIRKIPKKKYDLDKLQQYEMINKEIKSYLRNAVKGGLTIFFTGKGASGKTTLMNALIDEIPYDASALVIQEAEELHSNKHPDMMFQKVKYAKGESKIQYTLRDLSINGLLIDLDYFIIGEIKGPEAYDMANAIYTGHVGMASVHGNSAEEATNKLVHYMKYASDMKKSELLEMLSNIDVIVFMKDFKVAQVTEVAGYDYERERLIFNRVFQYNIKENDGQITANFVRVNESCEKINNKILYAQYKAEL